MLSKIINNSFLFPLRKMNKNRCFRKNHLNIFFCIICFKEENIYLLKKYYIQKIIHILNYFQKIIFFLLKIIIFSQINHFLFKNNLKMPGNDYRFN